MGLHIFIKGMKVLAMIFCFASCVMLCEHIINEPSKSGICKPSKEMVACAAGKLRNKEEWRWGGGGGGRRENKCSY